MSIHVEFVLEETLFSADVVARTAQRFTAEYFVDVSRGPNSFLVRLKLPDSTDAEDLVERFKNEALDERLREHVRAETRELHNALVRAAMRGATAPGDA